MRKASFLPGRAPARRTPALSLRAVRRVLLPLLLLAGGCARQAPPVGKLSVEPRELQVGYPRTAELRLAWEPTAAVERVKGGLRVFVHLLDPSGGVVRTFDHPFPGEWIPGKPIRYTLPLGLSALAPPPAPGRYRLVIGLYDAAGKRWEVATAGEEIAHRERVAATVEVPDGGPWPTFALSDAWDPPEESGDRQVVVRRWFDDPAAIEVDGVREAGKVRLRLAIPEVDPSTSRLVLDPGRTRQEIDISSTCDGSETTIGGAGPHAVELPVVSGARCRLTLTPRYSIVHLDSLARRSAVLEELVFVPGT